MRTVCPQCSQPIEVPDAYEGREIKCKSCKTTYIAKLGPDIIYQPPTRQSPPKMVDELLNLPSSRFPHIMGDICVAFSILSLIWAIVVFCMAFNSNYGIDELMSAVGKAIRVSIGSLLIAVILRSFASIIDAINANTKRKK